VIKLILIFVALTQAVARILSDRETVALSAIVSAPELSPRKNEPIGMRRSPVDHQGRHPALGSPSAGRR